MVFEFAVRATSILELTSDFWKTDFSVQYEPQTFDISDELGVSYCNQ
jgi:hypothetical protein